MPTSQHAKAQPPFNISGYNRSLTFSTQPSSFPPVFLDAVRVREQVFHHGQGFPLMMEVDEDDGRSHHWVVYYSTSENDGNSNSIPIGTIRLVPYPHAKHPEPGSTYSMHDVSDTSEIVQAETLPFVTDRPTSFHDGKEPYVKLGRLAVVEKYRNEGVATLLVNTALSFIRSNPSVFGSTPDGLSWNGLVLAHAQQRAAHVWAKWGFVADQELGVFNEGDVPHLGMFRRLSIHESHPLVKKWEKEVAMCSVTMDPNGKPDISFGVPQDKKAYTVGDLREIFEAARIHLGLPTRSPTSLES